MEKKTTKKAEKKDPVKRSGTKVVPAPEVPMEILTAIAETNERIDRIVAAISNSKSVKGL
jgi:hypothetical protein